MIITQNAPPPAHRQKEIKISGCQERMYLKPRERNVQDIMSDLTVRTFVHIGSVITMMTGWRGGTTLITVGDGRRKHLHSVG